MTKSELIAKLAARYPQLVAKDAELAVKMIIDAMAKSLSLGQRMEIRGFGEATSRSPSVPFGGVDTDFSLSVATMETLERLVEEGLSPQDVIEEAVRCVIQEYKKQSS